MHVAVGTLAALAIASTPASAGTLYWVDSPTTIARADLTSQGVANINRSFLTGLTNVYGLAVTDTHIHWVSSSTHLYWRADVNGENRINRSLGGAAAPRGLAVRGNYAYYGNIGWRSIGRLEPDSPGLPTPALVPISDPNEPWGVFTTATHLYWTERTVGTTGVIGRSALDGTAPDHAFTPCPPPSWPG